MRTEFGEALLDVIALRPDAAVDDRVLVVGEVHEARKARAESGGIENGEGEPARRRRREEAEGEMIQGVRRTGAGGFVGFKQQRALGRERQGERQRKLRRARERQARVIRNRARVFGEVHLQLGKGTDRIERLRRLPVLHEGGVPAVRVTRSPGTRARDLLPQRRALAQPV